MNETCSLFVRGRERTGVKTKERDKPTQGVVVNTLKLQRDGAVGFIDWLGLTLPRQELQS